MTYDMNESVENGAVPSSAADGVKHRMNHHKIWI
jgi:hypothetical protein